MHCASKQEWRGHKAKQSCGVLIIALERADLYRRRLHAYQLRDNLHGLPIAVASAVIDLLDPACVDLIVTTTRQAEQHLSCAIGMIVIDTYSKGIAAGGGDEDKARDQNRAAANMRNIHSQLDIHIATVGHTGKDEARGARGSNAHLGDVDVMAQISGDAIKSVEVIKGNDTASLVIAQFKLAAFEFGLDEDGDPIRTFILSTEQFKVGPIKAKKKLADKPKAALRSLFECIADGNTVPVPSNTHIPKSVTSVTSLQIWKCDAQKRGIIGTEGNHREEFQACSCDALKRRFYRHLGGNCMARHIASHPVTNDTCDAPLLWATLPRHILFPPIGGRCDGCDAQAQGFVRGRSL